MPQNTVDRLKITGGFLIFLTVCAVYSPFWNSSPIYYQDHLLFGLLEKWASGAVSNLEMLGGRVSIGNGFGPLTMLSYLVDHTLYGGNYGMYHVTGILLHAGTCVCIYFILLQLAIQVEAAFWTGMIFSLHPLHTLGIGWIQARGELLSGFFAVLSVLSFVVYIKNKKIWPISISAVLSFFAILSNERLILLPVLLFVFILARTKIKENLLQLLVFAVILSGPIISYSLFRLILKNPASPSGVVGMNLFYNAHIIPETLARFFVPARLPIMAPYDPVFLILGLAILVGLALAGFFAYKKSKVITFFAGLTWYAGFMIPAVFTWMKLGEVAVYPLSNAYVAIIGMVLPLASLLEMLQALLNKYYSFIVIIVTIVFFGLTVHSGSRYLHGDQFWKAFMDEQPDNTEVYRGRFMYLLEQEKYKESEQLAQSIIKSFDLDDEDLHWFVQSFESKEQYEQAKNLLIRFKSKITNETMYHSLIRNLILCGDLDLLKQYLRPQRYRTDTLIAHLDGYITLFRQRGKLEYSQKLIIGKSVIQRL